MTADGALKPVPMLPGVPAITDTLPGFETHECNGLCTPAGTPPPSSSS